VLLRHPSLTTVTLERCHVDEAGAELLRGLLAGTGASLAGGAECRSSSVETLRLVRCSLPVASALTLADALKAACGLRAFVFSGNAIEPTAGRAAAAAAFAAALRAAPPGLRHLTLGFSRGCPAAAEALASVVADGATPAGLRNIVLHRREVSPGGLAAWAAALESANRRGAAVAGDTPAALTLRTTTLQALEKEAAAAAVAAAAAQAGASSAGTSLAASSSAGSLRDTPGNAGGSGIGQLPRISAHLRPRRTVSVGQDSGAGDAADASDRRLLLTDELPIMFVLDADRDALGEAWLLALSDLLSVRGGRATVPVPALRPLQQHRRKPSGMAAAADAAVRDTQLERDAGRLPSAGAARPQEDQRLQQMPPRLCVLSSSDTGDAVATALKGLPLTALDLTGLELGPRVSAWGVPGCT
jgi:hypothetical protein